jgi:hypothetical protein
VEEKIGRKEESTREGTSSSQDLVPTIFSLLRLEDERGKDKIMKENS